MIRKQNELTAGLMALATAEAMTDAGRLRLLQSLGLTLIAVAAQLSLGDPSLADPVTAGVADALDGFATSLAQAADHAAHLATHARVIAPPHRPLG